MDRLSLSLILILFFPCLSWSQDDPSTIRINVFLIGKPAPDLVLPKTDGSSSKVIDSRQGHKALLIFWATWCPECDQELLGVNPAAYEAKGIKVILVNIGETKQRVGAFFQQHGIKLISFLDQDESMQETYRVRLLPMMVFIDEKAIVRHISHIMPHHPESYFN